LGFRRGLPRHAWSGGRAQYGDGRVWTRVDAVALWRCGATADSGLRRVGPLRDFPGPALDRRGRGQVRRRGPTTGPPGARTALDAIRSAGAGRRTDIGP